MFSNRKLLAQLEVQSVTLITSDEYCKQHFRGRRSYEIIFIIISLQFANNLHFQLKVTNCFVCFKTFEKHSIASFSIYYYFSMRILNTRFVICCIIILMPLSDDHSSKIFLKPMAVNTFLEKKIFLLYFICTRLLLFLVNLKLQLLQSSCHHKEEIKIRKFLMVIKATQDA